MRKIFFRKEFFPRPDENLMKNVGNVRLARERYLQNKPSNLAFLLEKRYAWMNNYILPHEKGIEVGCGTGLSKEFIKRNYALTDFADNSWLDQKVDALNMPYETSSLDYIISSNMIHHLAKPHLFFEECRRVLKPAVNGGGGGRILVQEIYTSLTMRALLYMTNHEGYSYNIDPFDKNTICNDPNDLWSANCALPEILFSDSEKFRKEFGFKLKDKKYSEFMLFPLSGGVIATKSTINLPRVVLKIIDSIDSALCAIAPNLFALQFRFVLENDK